MIRFFRTFTRAYRAAKLAVRAVPRFDNVAWTEDDQKSLHHFLNNTSAGQKLHWQLQVLAQDAAVKAAYAPARTLTSKAGEARGWHQALTWFGMLSAPVEPQSTDKQTEDAASYRSPLALAPEESEEP